MGIEEHQKGAKIDIFGILNSDFFRSALEESEERGNE